MGGKVSVNPNVLVWARESAGLNIEEAAGKIGLITGAKETAAEKLAKIEIGEREPTQAQLTKMAAAYHRPLVSLYMQEPPRSAATVEDFRTMKGTVSRRDAANLDALVRSVRARHGILKTMMEDDEDLSRVTIVGSLKINSDISTASDFVRSTLKTSDEFIKQNKINTPEDLFADLRKRVENIGVFVVLIGDLGHHTTAVSSSVFRGFAIADSIAPFIVINDQDAKAAWSFTLIHELVHIFLGETGISGNPDIFAPSSPNNRIERFCNEVASEVLLPRKYLDDLEYLDTLETLLAEIERLAHTWKVSQSMVAYRIWASNRTSDGLYRTVVSMIIERWRIKKALDKEKNGEKEGGPNYYIIKRHRLGDALLRYVGSELRNEAVTHSTAAKVLGVKLGSVDTLISKFLDGPTTPSKGKIMN